MATGLLDQDGEKLGLKLRKVKTLLDGILGKDNMIVNSWKKDNIFNNYIKAQIGQKNINCSLQLK